MPRTPLVEFALNSSINSSSSFALFELKCGYMLQLIPFPTDDIKYYGVKEFVQRVQANLVIAHDAIIEARVLSTHQANRLRTKEHPFLIGDLVYLSTANLNLPKRRVCKLAPKYIGPFEVTKAIPETSDYELALLKELIARCIHPRFHVSLLRQHEPNNDLLFPSWESKRMYNFGMPVDATIYRSPSLM